MTDRVRSAATALLLFAIAAASASLYFAGQQKNPPGFYSDESSIAWNALSIARRGVDEYDVPFPFYFRAFGEYKNPVYIYALAGVLRFFPPSNLVCRRLSALFGYLGALALGWLGWRISRDRFVALTTFLTALATPNLFETSRLVFEVALMPLATALVLLAAWRSSTRDRWNLTDVLALTAALAFLTYSYSSGRMLGPLFLAAFCILYYRRERRLAIGGTVALYLTTTIFPILSYNARNGGALTVRARALSVFKNFDTMPLRVIAVFERNVAADLLPLRASLLGDLNERHHVAHSGGSILLMTFILVALSLFVVSRRRPIDRWWIFIAFGAVVSVLPAAITTDEYHNLRLITYPVFLIVLSIPALQALEFRKPVFAAIAIGIIQVAIFGGVFVGTGRSPARALYFESGARQIVSDALAQKERPIFVTWDMKVHAYWYAAQQHVGRSAFAYVDGPAAAPRRGLLITAAPCNDCELLSTRGSYSLYRIR